MGFIGAQKIESLWASAKIRDESGTNRNLLVLYETCVNAFDADGVKTSVLQII